MLRKLFYSVSFVILVSISFPAKADFVITNGDFEVGAGPSTPDVNDWYDNNAGGFWSDTWQSNDSWITPNGSQVVIFSGEDVVEGDLLAGSYLYQSIGTSSGESSIWIGFEWGHPDDTGEGRADGLTVSVLASDGSFVADDANDVLGAAGITLLDSASYEHVALGTDGEIFPVVVELDLSGANKGDEIFLRFNNYWVTSTQSWPILDNVEIQVPGVDDPSDMADSSGDIKRIEAWVNEGNLNLTMTVYGVFAPSVEDTPAGMSNRYYYHWILDTDNNPDTGYFNDEYEGNPTNLETPIGVDVLIQFGWRDGATNGVYAYTLDLSTGDEVELFEDYEYTIDGDTIHAVIPLEDLGLEPGQTIAVSGYQEGASNDWQVDWVESFELTLAAVAPKSTIAWVSYHAADDEPHADAAAVGFTQAPDIGYTDLLKANGYDVTRVLTSQTPDVEYLNTFDLVIISRTASSGHYSGTGATAWNSITAPMINLNGYTLRSSRLGFTDGTTMVDTTGDVRLAVTDPTHPIFAGISITDGVMDNMYAEGAVPLPTDGTISRGISINNNNLDEEGTVLATVAEVSADTGPVGGMVIAELPAGATLQNSSGSPDDVLGGPRLVFLTGSREPSGVTGGQAAALYDLYPDGEKMFLNAVKYMLPAAPVAPVHSYTFEDGTGNDSVSDADGVLVGDAAIVDGSLVVDGDGDWMEMPGDVIAINAYSEMTLELWSTQSVDNPFSMTASFGGTWDNGMGKDYIFIATGRGDQMNRGAIANTPDEVNPWEDEVGVSSPELNDGIEHHYVLTITAAELAYYVDGVLIGTAPMGDTTIAGVSNDFVYLGKGIYSVDGTMNCSINEFNIYDMALGAEQIAANYVAGPAE